MFTGIVREIGTVVEVVNLQKGKAITFECKDVIKKADIGDSICVEGVCLTAIELTDTTFKVELMHETLKKTTFKNVKVGDKVNLEPSLTLNQYLDGHLLYGDVDYCSEILSIFEDGIAKIVKFSLPAEFGKFFINKGRVSIDGTSLTLINVDETSFSVSLIPHTLESVTLGQKNVGDFVNIEVDILAKQLDKIASGKKSEVIEEFFNIKKYYSEVENGSN